jgi:molecular chaperone GrpE (heat shock protein)
MNDFSLPEPPRTPLAPPLSPSMLDDVTQGTSSLYRLFEAFIGLREKNERQHKLFEQSLAKSRDTIQASFNSFAADTQRAYQQLRQEIHGEKRISLVLLNELMEIGLDLEQIVAARPSLTSVPAGEQGGDEEQAVGRWADAVEVQCRKVGAALVRHGIHRFDAVVGTPYNPALHERVGSKRVEGMDALRVAEQAQHGFASQQPEFVLRRPKVIVTE